MKKQSEKIFISVFIVVAYLLKTIEDKQFDWVYIFSFLFSVLSLYLIKNKYISMLLCISILVGAMIYKAVYIPYILPALLLIYIHKNIIKKNESVPSKIDVSYNVEFIFLQLLLFAGVGEAIYCIITIVNEKPSVLLFRLYNANFLFLVLLIICLLGKFSKKTKIKIVKKTDTKKEVLYILNIMNFTALILFAITVLYSYAKYQQTRLNYTTIYFPWLVWILTILYEENPLTERILIFLEEKLTEIGNKGILK